MKKRFMWLLISCLVILSLVLSSCAPATPGGKEVTPPPTTSATAPETGSTSLPMSTGTPLPSVITGTTTEKPKYGGTVIIASEVDTIGWDIEQQDARVLGPAITNEDLLIGDWTKGPAGSNQTEWELRTMLLDIFTGYLAESWSIPDANTIIYKIRKGVHFAINPNSEASRMVNGRELTAEDVAYNIQRTFGNTWSYYGRGYPGYLQSVETPDKYTVIVHGKDTELTRTARAFEDISGACRMYAPEIIGKYGDARDWKNSVGSGPFYLTDYVAGSSLSFNRNPNYWMTDPIGPGKGNQLPYLDSVKILVIPDMSTRLAALRTGKIDWMMGISIDDWKTMTKSNPNLQSAPYLGVSEQGGYIAGRIDKDLPFNDIRVRRAMLMAVDQATMIRDYYGGQAELLWFPTASAYPTLYTPIEDLPAADQDLYKYNPEKARQLLTEAGYPNGFKTEVVVPMISDVVDRASIYKEYLAKVGIDMEIKAVENSIWQSIRQGRKHAAMIFATPAFDNPYKITHAEPGNSVNNVGIDDLIVNDASAKIWAYENLLNPEERARQVKIRTLRTIEQAWFLTFPKPYQYRMWQPWLKNYHGEMYVRYWDNNSWTYWIWYDEEMKKSMGY